LDGCWDDVAGVEAEDAGADEDAEEEADADGEEDDGAGSDSGGKEPQAKNRKKQEISIKQKIFFFINNSFYSAPLVSDHLKLVVLRIIVRIPNFGIKVKEK